MKRCVSAFLLFATHFVILLPSPASSTLTGDWSQRFGDTSTELGYAVAVDGAGNVLLAGRFGLTVDLGGGVLTSAGGNDIFVAKFDAAGTHLWSQRFGDANNQYPYDLAVDASGNVLLAGKFDGTVDFGGGALTSSGVGDYDIFVAKLDASGAHLWSQRFGDTDPFQQANAIASDGAGNVIVTGEFQGTLDFGGGPLSSVGWSYDIFVAKFDPSGAHLWSHSYGDENADEVDDIAVDGADNILLVGSFQGFLNFGISGGFTSAGDYDIYVVKLGPSGTGGWEKRFGDAGVQKGYAVAVDGAGDVLATGYFQSSVDFGGGVLTSAGGSDIFVAKFGGLLGNHIWSQHFGDTSNQIGRDIMTDGPDNVVVTGSLAGTADFGGGPLTSAGGDDIFVTGFDASSGAHLWSERYGDADMDLVTAVDGDGTGNYYLTGFFIGSLDFGDSPLTSAGSNDAFLARLSPAEAAIQAVNDVPGDQGGWARVHFTRALYDRVGGTATPVLSYYIFRRVDNPALIARVANEAGATSSVGELPDAIGGAALIRFDGRSFRQTASAALWEAVATVPARQEAEYIGLVPTLADSGSVVQYSVYFVMAQTTVPWVYYDSPPDSGYSVDNLSPAPPMNLTGEQSGATALLLTWDANSENDLSHYAVYRDVTSNFSPSEGNLVGTPATPALVDNDWTWDGGYYYKVAAVDIHGNESSYAVLAPENATGVGGDSPILRTYLEQNQPNPFNPTTRIGFGLKEAGNVSLRIYDAGGRLVRVLVSGRLEARHHWVEWNGRDDRNRPVASGVYFYRLETGRETLTLKAVLLK